MVMFAKSSVYMLALVAFSSLFDGTGLGLNTGNGIGVFVGAAPTPYHRPGDSGVKAEGRSRVRFRREDVVDEAVVDGDGGDAPAPPPETQTETETLGKLLKDYSLLKAAVPAAPEGSDLQNALLQEIDHKKQIISDKFGQVVPDDGTGDLSQIPPGTTVSSADGSVITILPNPDGPGIIIASNGQNQTVSLGPNSSGGQTPQAGAGDQQAPPTPTSSLSSTTTPPTEQTPTSTSTVVTVSTGTAPASGTTTSTSFVSPSASATRENAGVAVRPFDILPTSMAMKSLFTVTAAMAFGAWSVL